MAPLPQTTNQRIAAFGPYIVDVQSGQLRKHGTKVKLGEQPFQILLLLLERQGGLVTRDEIQARLWATDTFVDFERSLNSAVQRLRDSLSDTAEKARWIETVPRRGYRFAGHVAWSGGFAPVVPESSNGHQHSCDEDVATTVNGELSPEQKAATRVTSLRIAVLAIGTLILSLAVIPFVKRMQHVRLANKDTIVLADFINSTGDAVFDDTLNAALHISLRQSPFLNVLSDGDIAATLQEMTRPAGTRLTPVLARELCLRAGSKAYVVGSIGNLGSQYVLELKAVNCQNGDTLAQEQVVAASKERVLDSLGGAASKVREALGESLASIQKFDVPLEQATTVSLEALKAHTLGRKVDHEQGAAAALPYDMQSIGLDPNFAMGYLTTGGDYEDLGQRGRARDYYAQAFELRQHASERERLRITAVYYDTVTGELYKAAQAYQQEIDSYPRESMAYFSLAYVYSLLGQYEKAVEVVRQGMRTIPADRVESLGGGTLFTSALALQRFDEAQLAIDQLQSRKVDDERIHLARYILCILGSDSAAIAEQEQWFAGKPNFENLVLALASDTQAYAGHLSRSRELTDQAVDAALRTDSKETAAKWLAIAAQREAAYGYAAEARRKADEALELAPEGQGVENGAALAIALLGDTAKAESLAKDLEERYPLDTQVHSLWLPAIRGRVALDRKNPAQALKGLQASSSIEYGGIPSVINNSCLYHVYVRGEAYLAMGKGSAAAAEFQKILDHRGLVWNCWTGALAHLGVARANALQTMASGGADAGAARVSALAAYKDFLTLWKEADPNIPILKEAKAEYAKLQ